MKFAICDDNKEELSIISSIIKEYSNIKRVDITCRVFQNATDFLSLIKPGEYDLIILDVLMPGINGIQVAREIRDFDDEVKIIFLTSSPEFAIESYEVQATDYLLKPVNIQKFSCVLDRLFIEKAKPEDSLSIKTQTGFLKISMNKIEYLEVNAKKVYIHLIDGSVKIIFGNLSEFEEKLVKRPEFIKVHRSYLINMKWIEEFTTKEIITINKQRVPIARSVSAKVRETYSKYLFTEVGAN